MTDCTCTFTREVEISFFDYLTPADRVTQTIAQGSVDTRYAIQAAINYAASLTGTPPTNVNITSLVKVSLAGNVCAISAPLTMSGIYGVELANGKLLSLSSASWLSTNAAVVIDTTSWFCGLTNVNIDCQRFSNGVFFNGSQKCFADKCFVQRQLAFGFQTQTTNGEVKLTRCSAYEFAFSDLTNNTYANRTSIGFNISSADGMMSNCVGALCKETARFSGVSNFQISNCHFWQGVYDSDRHTPLLTVQADAHHMQFDQCYFDAAVVVLYGFDHKFTGCFFTQGSAGKNTFGIEAVATVAGSTCDQLIIDGSELAGTLSDIEFTTSGVGTWATETAPTLISTGSVILSQQGVRNTRANYGIHNRAQGVMHMMATTNFSNGFGASSWGVSVYNFPIFMGAKSVSGTVGTYGGYVTNGQVLARFGGVQDRGTDFGNSTFSSPGAWMEARAAENHTGATQATELVFATTPSGSVGNAVDSVKFTSYGGLKYLRPIAVASLPAAATAGAGATAFVSDSNATTFAAIVTGGGTNQVPVYCDGTNWRIG